VLALFIDQIMKYERFFECWWVQLLLVGLTLVGLLLDGLLLVNLPLGLVELHLGQVTSWSSYPLNMLRLGRVTSNWVTSW
jgi:hypothetical protein